MASTRSADLSKCGGTKPGAVRLQHRSQPSSSQAGRALIGLGRSSMSRNSTEFPKRGEDIGDPSTNPALGGGKVECYSEDVSDDPPWPDGVPPRMRRPRRPGWPWVVGALGAGAGALAVGGTPAALIGGAAAMLLSDKRQPLKQALQNKLGELGGQLVSLRKLSRSRVLLVFILDGEGWSMEVDAHEGLESQNDIDDWLFGEITEHVIPDMLASVDAG